MGNRNKLADVNKRVTNKDVKRLYNDTNIELLRRRRVLK